MHIGESAMRFLKVTDRIVSGSNSLDMGAAKVTGDVWPVQDGGCTDPLEIADRIDLFAAALWQPSRDLNWTSSEAKGLSGPTALRPHRIVIGGADFTIYASFLQYSSIETSLRIYQAKVQIDSAALV
jgi:hypothetical protein